MIEVCGAQMSVGDGWQLCGLEPGHSGSHGWEQQDTVDPELLIAIALLSECRSTMPRTYGGEPNMTWVRVDAFLNRVGSDDNEPDQT